MAVLIECISWLIKVTNAWHCSVFPLILSNHLDHFPDNHKSPYCSVTITIPVMYAITCSAMLMTNAYVTV